MPPLASGSVPVCAPPTPMFSVPAVMPVAGMFTAPVNVLAPPIVWAVDRSTKFFVAEPVPPEARANGVTVRVRELKLGVLERLRAGVVPPDEVSCPEAVTDVTGAVTRAVRGILPALRPEPEPVKLVAVIPADRLRLVTPVSAPAIASEPLIVLAPFAMEVVPTTNAPALRVRLPEVPSVAVFDPALADRMTPPPDTAPRTAFVPSSFSNARLSVPNVPVPTIKRDVGPKIDVPAVCAPDVLIVPLCCVPGDRTTPPAALTKFAKEIL